MKRGDVWLAEVGGKRRPVLIMTRTEVIDVRAMVTIAEITTSIRGIAAEVPLDHEAAGVDQQSVINCDGIHTVRQTMLTKRIGRVAPQTMSQTCAALGYALGC